MSLNQINLYSLEQISQTYTTFMYLPLRLQVPADWRCNPKLQLRWRQHVCPQSSLPLLPRQPTASRQSLNPL